MRLKPESLSVTVGGRNIIETTRLSVTDALAWYAGLPELLTERENQIARQVLKEIRARLHFLIDVGLDYLTLDRASGTLSGGEAQRIRLATQIGSSLMGVLYILDEPSIGLHQRDNAPADRDAGAAARPGQHADRGRARRGDDPVGGLGDRHRAGGRRARRRADPLRAAGRADRATSGRSPPPTCAATSRWRCRRVVAREAGSG